MAFRPPVAQLGINIGKSGLRRGLAFFGHFPVLHLPPPSPAQHAESSLVKTVPATAATVSYQHWSFGEANLPQAPCTANATRKLCKATSCRAALALPCILHLHIELKMLNLSSAKFCDERHDSTIHCMDHVTVVPSCHARPLKLSRLPGQT